MSETILITTPKPHIFLLYLLWRIQWHCVSRGMPHPLHYVKGLLSQKPFWSLNHIHCCSSDNAWGYPGQIYSCSLWWYIQWLSVVPFYKTHPMTVIVGPLESYTPSLPIRIRLNSFFWWKIKIETESTWELIWVLGVHLVDYNHILFTAIVGIYHNFNQSSSC